MTDLFSFTRKKRPPFPYPPPFFIFLITYDRKKGRGAAIDKS
jgi:hypothetical protein